MKINLAKSAGFCFGVERAIKIASETARLKKNVLMLGDIVHNEKVIEMITRAGIKKIKRLSRGEDKILLIRAHGTSLKTITKAKKLGYKIVDATCPMVKEIHRIVKTMEKEGCRIIIIGDKRHEEVSGIIGQLKGKALVIENEKDIALKKIKRFKKACVVVQSTQNIDKVKKIVDFLRTFITNLKFFNTICRTTRIKQQEIKLMPLNNQVMIIIGSKNSANTKRLYEISKSLNPRTYWVQSHKDLKEAWFKDITEVGVTAGASTPDITTRQVIAKIKKINKT